MDIHAILTCWLQTLAENHSTQWSRILTNKKSKFKFVVEWLVRQTPAIALAEKSLRLNERLWWVINGVKSADDLRVHCRTCGKPLYGEKFVSLSLGYRGQFCCKKCANSNLETRAKNVATRLSKNGGKYFSDESLRKHDETCMRNYGAKNNMQSEKGLKEYQDTIEALYGVRNQFQRPEVIQQIEDTKEERYGDRKYNNSEKAQETIERIPDFYEKRNQKSVKTWISSYGTDHPMKNKDVSAKAAKRAQESRNLIWEDLNFDSAPELAYYIWLRDTGADFSYHDCQSFEFEFRGGKYLYFPDFKVGQEYHEIKGDQFFREDGTMFLPWRKKDWSDEKYQFECGKFDAKYRCMIQHGVKIIRTGEYKLYLDYVGQKYGKDFLESCRVNKSVSC